MNLQNFLLRHTPVQDHQDFFSADQFPLDDEAIADTAINAMLLVMNNRMRPAPNTKKTRIEDYAPLVAAGIRFPWKDRIALGLCIDTVNDQIPEYTAIGLTRYSKNVFAQAVVMSTVRSNSLPRFARVALNGANSFYRTAHLKGFDGLSRAMVNRGSDDIETVTDGGFAGVMPNGYVIGVDDYGRMSTWHANLLAYAVSIHNDFRYFWEVTATEEFLYRLPAKAIFSIDVEYIKSLFYARSVPITATGRLRPILHWVTAHKRRMKEGIDIDVRKHLRGIDTFEMHGVNFVITEPRKAQANNTSLTCAEGRSPKASGKKSA